MEPQQLQQLGLILDAIGVSLVYVFGIHRGGGGSIIWPGLGGTISERTEMGATIVSFWICSCHCRIWRADRRIVIEQERI